MVRSRVSDQRANQNQSYVIVHSTESTQYQLWQSLASYHSFTTTGQRPDAMYARLVTLGHHQPGNAIGWQPGRAEYRKGEVWSDWLSDKGIPSYFYDRDHLTDRYGPFNKPDVFAKWMNSPDAPKKDVLVILDPDSFLVRDLSPEVDLVKPGKGRAANAFYVWQRPAVQDFYRNFCESIGRKATERLDLVAVPYLVHRKDMERLAPLWREFTVKIKNSKWADTPWPLDVHYTAEMYAFNFAAAQLGIWFDTNEKLQVRDVDFMDVPHHKYWYTIHTGRAWFPHDYHEGRKWQATSFMQEFTSRGYEVWCKCNATGREVIPWPLPAKMDPVSRQTLTVLHEAFEGYGHPVLSPPDSALLNLK
jgi:hypothetical protein